MELEERPPQALDQVSDYRRGGEGTFIRFTESQNFVTFGVIDLFEFSCI